MKKPLSLFFKIIIIFALFISSSNATGPGDKVELIEEKDFVVDLFLVEVEIFEDGRLRGAYLIWIPKEVVNECLGQDYKACRSFHHKNYYLKRKPERWKRFFGRYRYPSKVLGTWIAFEDRNNYSKDNLIILSKKSFVAEMINANMLKVPISKDKKIRAKIHWELWPNGQNFRVLKIIQK